MDITLIWFPVLKGIITLGLLYGVYYFIKTNRTTVGLWYVGILVFFWVLTPFRYDGTNSVKQNVQAQELRTDQYKEVAIEKTVVTTTKPTFAERLEAEQERSHRENMKVIDEILK